MRFNHFTINCAGAQISRWFHFLLPFFFRTCPRNFSFDDELRLRLGQWHVVEICNPSCQGAKDSTREGYLRPASPPRAYYFESFRPARCLGLRLKRPFLHGTSRDAYVKAPAHFSVPSRPSIHTFKAPVYRLRTAPAKYSHGLRVDSSHAQGKQIRLYIPYPPARWDII
jgi:hypothetical protein